MSLVRTGIDGWDDPLRHLIREIESFPAPVIAMIEGGIWGGASEHRPADYREGVTAFLQRRRPSFKGG